MRDAATQAYKDVVGISVHVDVVPSSPKLVKGSRQDREWSVRWFWVLLLLARLDELQEFPISLAAHPSFVPVWVDSGAGEGLERGREVLAKWGQREMGGCSESVSKRVDRGGSHRTCTSVAKETTGAAGSMRALRCVCRPIPF